MPRTKLKDRTMPVYTRGEEIFNMTTHIVGGSLGLIGMIICVVISILHNDGYAIVGSIVYGIALIFLYIMSSVYHGLRADKTSKRVMQVMDHCTIYVLIAGTYTPVLLCGIMKISPAAAWILLAIVWTMAIIGIVFNAIDLKQFKVFSMICYLVMGWCIIFRIDLLIKAIGVPGFALILAGGIVYTVGTIFYGLGRNKKYMHSIFHLCVVIASILQYLAIVLYVI